MIRPFAAYSEASTAGNEPLPGNWEGQMTTTDAFRERSRFDHGTFGRTIRLLRLLCAVTISVTLMFCAMLFSGGQAEAEPMLASYYGYGDGFHGQPTANGETFDANGLTGANKDLPFGIRLLCSYGQNTVEVRINDRGPYYGDRQIDLSYGAALQLGLTEAGVDYVDCKTLGAADSVSAPEPPVTEPVVAATNVSVRDQNAGEHPEGNGDLDAQLNTSAEGQGKKDPFNTAAVGLKESDGSASAGKQSSGSGGERVQADVGGAVSDVARQNEREQATDVAARNVPGCDQVSQGTSTCEIRADDNLHSIAVQKGTSVAKLTEYNERVTDPDLIYAGQPLRLTDPYPDRGSHESGATYEVKSGDTLLQLAGELDTSSVQHLVAYNPEIVDADVIYAGQVLRT